MPDPTPVTEMTRHDGRVPGRAIRDNSSYYSCRMRAALDLTPDLISDEVNTKIVFIVGHGHG